MLGGDYAEFARSDMGDVTITLSAGCAENAYQYQHA
jgi:hypothetical protein